MTDDEMKIVEAFGKCADARLPDDFADRLVKRIRTGKDPEGEKSPLIPQPHPSSLHLALVAASLTLLLGFVPNVLDTSSDRPTPIVAHCDEIRPASRTLPQDGQLNTLAFLGFCREAIRRRVRMFLLRNRKREDGD